MSAERVSTSDAGSGSDVTKIDRNSNGKGRQWEHLELREQARPRKRRRGCGNGGGDGPRPLELGAEVHVFDLKEPTSDVASFRSVDLRDPSAIDAAVAELGGRVDALFNCAGLPGPPFSGLDTMLVNFVAARH